mgnify:CR=1 FL=1|tara:strand:+ start:1576 stop:1725 length:150 start_codon:yes stop_codon:yes gene_type:complete
MTKIKDISLTEVIFTIYTDGVMFYIADEDGVLIAEEDTLEDLINLTKNL